MDRMSWREQKEVNAIAKILASELSFDPTQIAACLTVCQSACNHAGKSIAVKYK